MEAPKRSPRFPGITWYCDNCGAVLNNQPWFNDHKYTWKCKECGYKNSISWDNINAEDSIATKFLLRIVGFISFVGFWTSIMLGISIFGLGADKGKYLDLFLGALGLYLFAAIIAIIIEFTLRHTTFKGKYLLRVIFRNIKEEILVPFMCVKELLSIFLNFITHKLPFMKKYEWHSNKGILAFSIIYLLIFIVEIVAFNNINGFTFSDWANFIH